MTFQPPHLTSSPNKTTIQPYGNFTLYPVDFAIHVDLATHQEPYIARAFKQRIFPLDLAIQGSES
jgi:hypothetical protein